MWNKAIQMKVQSDEENLDKSWLGLKIVAGTLHKITGFSFQFTLFKEKEVTFLHRYQESMH
jgi:hypothetical protein